MAGAKRRSVQFVGSPKLAEFLKGVARDNPETVAILSSREDKDSARLGMDFGLYWHILVGVAEGYSVLHLTMDLSRYFYSSKDREVIAKTPSREITIKVPANATREEIEEDVKARLNELFNE